MMMPSFSANQPQPVEPDIVAAPPAAPAAESAAAPPAAPAAESTTASAAASAAGAGVDLQFYARQMVLPQIGLAGQLRLHQASVLVIGAGGLGSPLLFNLAGAGIGRLGVVDVDVVGASNLNRQFLYTAADLGQSKAILAGQRLQAYHPDLTIEVYPDWLNLDLARDLFGHYDLVIAAVDNQATRRLINHVCCELGKPLIDGGIRGFSGYVTMIEPGKTPCFDCLFGYADLPWDAPERSGRTPPGALGATASVIASQEATLAVLYLLGYSNPLAGTILHYHGLTMDFRRITIERTPDCQACGALFPAHG